jgi:hypothetical protein
MYKLANPSVLEGKILYSVHKKDNELHLLTADGFQYKFCHFKGCCQQAVSAISGVLGKEIVGVPVMNEKMTSVFAEDLQEFMHCDDLLLFGTFFTANPYAYAHFILLGDGSGDNDGFPCFMELTDQHANPDVSPIES